MGEVYYNPVSGGVIAAGRTPYPHAALLNTIAAAPSGSWINVNANSIQSVFPSSDYCPPFGGGYSDPSTIILAWSGFGWDSKNHRLIIWGGGHANSSANHVFYWDATDLNWKLAFHSADVVYDSTSGYRNSDGDLHSPISSHTYSNNIYLPKIDRFLTFGGAAHGSGYSFVVRDGSTTLRGLPGGYTLDMANAGKGWVGGITGSNPKRGTTAGVDLTGANAWYPRDYLLDNPSHTVNGLGHVNGKAVYAEEGGKDVVYVAGSLFGGTSPHLFRIEYSSANDYTSDAVTKVGAAWNNNATDGGADIDPVRHVFVHIGDASYPLYGWDLKYAAANNNNFRIAPGGLTGSGATEFLAENLGGMGMLFDKQRGYFVLWSRGGKLWSIQVPDGDPTPTTGWVVTKLADPSSPRPALSSELAATNNEDTGVHGKWRYATDLDCYVGLQGKNAGNIWMFKPTSWIDPRDIKMAYTLNTSHALYGNLVELIGVQSGALVSHKAARTFTKHADASYGTGTYGEHFRTVNGGYTVKGATFSPSLVRDTYTNPNYSIVLVFNGREANGAANVAFLNNNGGTYTFSSPTWNSSGSAGVAKTYTNSMVSGTALGTGSFMVTTTRTEGAGNVKLYVGSTLAGTVDAESWNANTAVNCFGGYDGQGALGGDLVWVAIFDKVLSQAEIADLYSSLGASNAFGLVESAATGTDATAPGGTGTSTGSGSGGTATGGSAGTGSFTFPAGENNTHSGPMSGVSVNWAWHSGGAVGAASVITNGSGTMTTGGMTISGLPTGAGYGVLRSSDGTVVGYREGTVS